MRATPDSDSRGGPGIGVRTASAHQPTPELSDLTFRYAGLRSRSAGRSSHEFPKTTTEDRASGHRVPVAEWDAITMVMRVCSCGHNRRRAAHVEVSRSEPLAPKAEALDQGPVALDVGLGDVVEQAATLADQEHQAPAAVVVVLVLLEVLGQVSDPLREDRDLDLRGTRVALRRRVLGDDLLLFCSVDRHAVSFRFPLRGAPSRLRTISERVPHGVSGSSWVSAAAA